MKSDLRRTDSKVENKYIVKYEADSKRGSKKYPDIYAAQRYVEHLFKNTESGYAVILDEEGKPISGE